MRLSRLTPSKQIEFLNELKGIAKKNGGNLLTKKFIGSQVKYQFKCSNPSHPSWWSLPGNIRKNKWCKFCRGNSRIPFGWFQTYVKKHHGELLSSEKDYKNQNSKLTIKCSKHGIFRGSVAGLRSGKWCKKCGFESSANKQKAKKGLLQAAKLAEKHDGKCLSSIYVNSKSKLRFKCKTPQHPEFEMSLIKLKSGEQWCPLCGRTDAKKKLRVGLSHYRKIASKNSLKVLSYDHEIENAKSILRLKCSVQEHRPFELSGNELQQGSGCPYCTRYRLENVCRHVFEEYFESKFPKKRPLWLKLGKNIRLELDGYSDELQIAFEHQGRQHYEKDNFYSQNFKKIQKYDRVKRELCKKQGVFLFEIPELGYLTFESDIFNTLKNQARKNKRIYGLLVKNSNKKIKLPAANQSEYYKKLQLIVAQKSGRIVSAHYLGPQEKLEFECSLGHRWKARPAMIVGNSAKRPTWCPKCNKYKNQFSA